MSSEVPIPEAAVEAALLGAMGYDAVHDDDAPKGDKYFTEQMWWAVRAAAPLVVAAAYDRLADAIAAEEGTGSFSSGILRAVIEIQRRASVLRGEGQTDG